MANIAFYIEAKGVAEDEHGNPDYGSLKIDFGKLKPGVEAKPYTELIKDKDPAELLEKLLPAVFDKLSDVRFITPEEYEREYGEENGA